MFFILLGDRRERDDIPIFLPQHMADEVILMQALHDQDNAPVFLVIGGASIAIHQPLSCAQRVGSIRKFHPNGANIQQTISTHWSKSSKQLRSNFTSFAARLSSRF